MGLRGRSEKSERQATMGLRSGSLSWLRQKPRPFWSIRYSCLRPVHRSCKGFRVRITHKKGPLCLNGVMADGGQGVPQAKCILVRARREASGPKDISSSGECVYPRLASVPQEGTFLLCLLTNSCQRGHPRATQLLARNAQRGCRCWILKDLSPRTEPTR